jgi:hypothetical protein
MPHELANLFFELFRGLDRAHGTYKIDDQAEPGSKATGKAATIRKGPSSELWAKHLDGTQRLGVVPITDEGMSWFGAIDIDDYTISLEQLADRIRGYGLPLALCRSKSGGAHLYLFLKEQVSSSLVRDKLSSWAVVLGHPGVEIFPKQSQLANENDVGNWLNMPYFDANATTTYCIREGDALDASEFLEYANTLKVDEEQLKAVEVKLPDLPSGAPPCLQAMAANGVPEGNRNNVLFAFGVMARKLHEDDPTGDAWQDELESYNERFLEPPLRSREVGAIIKSVNTKNYFYPCNNEPLKSFCNKAACRQCALGIGGDGPADPGVMIDGVTKILTDPPTWIFRIAGVNIELDTDDFLSQARFKRKVVEKLNKVPTSLKQTKWEELINHLLQNAEEEEAPEDASSQGQFLTHLWDFCTRQSRGANEEALLTNGMWHDEEHDRIYFRSTYFEKYLKQQKFFDLSKKQVWAALRKIDGIQHGQSNVKGKNVQWWSVPAPQEMTGGYEVPRIPEEQF